MAALSFSRSLFNSTFKYFTGKRCVYKSWKLASVKCLSSLPDIKSSDLKLTKCTTSKAKPTNFSNIEFGSVFTDHMLTVKWSAKRGWETPEIQPYGNLSLDPSAKVFHYSLESFEGMKAYRGDDGTVRLFRPMKNMERLQRTNRRLCLPDFNGEEFLKCLIELIKVDQDWIPKEENCSLYIRPTVIGTTPTLGVNVADEVLFYCILSPVGPYFSTGSFNPVTLMADPQFVRSWYGGCGDHKAGGNYAPTVLAQTEAAKRNCEQVLWLYGDDEQITEVGTMNLFIFLENEHGEEELITPPTDGLILPGITRMSLLELAREWGDFKVSERKFTMADLRLGVEKGRIKEIFGSGTACLVCPVKDILHNNEILHIPITEDGPKLAKKFYNELSGIQYGRISHPWSVVIE